jgi:hypothetical protein
MKVIQQLALCALLSATMFCTVMLGQTVTTAPQPPRTKIEAFMAQTGVVIVSGFSTMGSVEGRNGGKVTVESREFLEAGTGRREYGITVKLKIMEEVEKESTAYIDYDEIPSLLRAIEFISKVQSPVTRLDNFKAEYQTRGDFRISAFSTNNAQTILAVSNDDLKVFLPIAKLDDLKVVMENAKARLDAIR